MTVEVVHPVATDELDGWATQVMTSLLFPEVGGPDHELSVARWGSRLTPERTWGARDRGRWVGTLATEPRVLTVPGRDGATADVGVDALTGVSVAATHRRRGLLRAMLDDSLRAARERGDALAALIAAEWPIYGRFGYAPATRAADYRLHRRRAGAAVEADPAGSLRMVDPPELARHATAVFDRARRRNAGQMDRSEVLWNRRLGQHGERQLPHEIGTWVLHEGPDGPDGMLRWRTTRDFELDGRLGDIKVADLVAGSDLAYRNLWAYLCGMDAVETVTLDGRHIEEPVRWLLADGRALEQCAAYDFLWLQLLDVPAALTARGYAADGELVLELIGTDGDAQRYLLEAGADGASCTATTRSAELTLPEQVLAGCYLGDRSLQSMALTGVIDEHVPGALARADRLFVTTDRPWNQTGF